MKDPISDIKVAATYFTVYPPLEVLVTDLGLDLDYRNTLVNEVQKLSKDKSESDFIKGKSTNFRLYKEPKIFDKFIFAVQDKIGKARYIGEDFFYEMSSLWGINYTKGDETTRHNHLPSLMSFIYYPKGSSVPLVFDECDFKITPIDDQLIVFDSILTHSSPPLDSGNKTVISGTIVVKENVIED